MFSAGPIEVNKSPPELLEIEKLFGDKVKPGGTSSPDDCLPRHRVAIVIPFRDRPQHLQALLFNLHPMLLRQQIDYQIFIVEQEGINKNVYIIYSCLQFEHENSFDFWANNYL